MAASITKTEEELKEDVFTVIKEVKKYDKKGFIKFDIDKFLKEWDKQLPGTKFKKFGHGNLKNFLVRVFEAKEIRGGEFQIEKMKFLGNGKRGVSVRSSKTNKAKLTARDFESNAITEIQTCLDQGGEGETQIYPGDEVVEGNISEAKSKSDADDLSTAIVEEETKMPLKRVVNNPTSVHASNGDKVDSPTSQQTERKNFIRLIVVMKKFVLETLRNVFMAKHPNWQNTPNDSENLKGKVILTFPAEKSKFKTGDINEWDISLIIKVLRFSESSKEYIESNGYGKALKTLQTIKNDCVSHASKPELKEHEYSCILNELKTALETFGVSSQQFDTAVQDADLPDRYSYYETFIEEVKSMGTKMDEGFTKVEDKLDSIIDKINKKEINQSQICTEASKADKEYWDTWERAKHFMGKFDSYSNQYILIADKVESSQVQYLSELVRLDWKIVLDLDPDSDISGFQYNAKMSGKLGSLIDTYTPTQCISLDVPGMSMDRVKWIFANGRNISFEKDLPKQELKDWNRKFRYGIHQMIDAYSSKLDPMKKVFYLILSLRNESVPIVQALLEEIDSICDSKKLKIQCLSLSDELNLKDYEYSHYLPLSLKTLFVGVFSLVGNTENAYLLPYHSGEFIPIEKKQFHFIAEYLEVLYQGCQKISNELREKDKKEFENNHLRSFLQGNPISFESLDYCHDVRREVSEKIKARINKIRPNLRSPQIVQICHPPGTGGTTIARRILWDLHDEIPCAYVKTKLLDGYSEIDSEQLVNHLTERTMKLEEVSNMSPLILIDGNSEIVRTISDNIVRKLHSAARNAVLLQCVHPQSVPAQNQFFYEKSKFDVVAVLEQDDNGRELEEFKMKYKDYCGRFDSANGTGIDTAARVFHFPMLCMIGEFSKVDEIIDNTLVMLKRDFPNEYEVAVLVSFLQIYSGGSIPAVLIAKYLKNESVTYDKLSKGFSNILLNLMVSRMPTDQRDFIPSKSVVDEDVFGQDSVNESTQESKSIQWYTFQHDRVAEKVLNYSKRSKLSITDEFIKSDVLLFYNKHRVIQKLVNFLFLYHGKENEFHFSKLMVELNSDEIFEQAAEKSEKVSFYAHAARFVASHDQSITNFDKALQLIKTGFMIDKKASNEAIRRAKDTEGNILLKKMKYLHNSKSITDIAELEQLAAKALSKFHKARDNPPMTYPNPLIGEVSVWQFCFDFIKQLYEGDAQSAFKFIMKSEFFNKAIGECFYLLDCVDQIVEMVPRLVDPELTRSMAKKRRMNLMQTFLIPHEQTKKKGQKNKSISDFFSKEICKGSEREMIRVSVAFLINQAGSIWSIHQMHKNERPKLLEWLKNLVIDYKDYRYALKLLRFATILAKDSLTLKEALNIAQDWHKNLPDDLYSHFFRYVICFLLVVNGNIKAYRPTCEDAVDTCIQKSKGSDKRFSQEYFIRKESKCDIHKISRLISRSELITEYSNNKKKNPSKSKYSQGDNLKLDDQFWSEEAEKYLCKCKGRLEYDKSKGESRFPCIFLEQGHLKVRIPPNQVPDCKLEYRNDARVTFMVAFTFSGPTARNIELLS